MAKKSKCPKCGSQELVVEKFKDNKGKYIAERIICRKCRKIKYAEEHGKIYYQDWKLPSDSPLKVPWFKKLFKKLFKKKRKKARKHA